MKPHTANLINGTILVLVGLWGYYEGSDGFTISASPTALIAPIAGVILLGLNSLLKKENKIVSHLIVTLTFLLFLSLFMPLMKREGIAQIRIIIMMVSCLAALVVFIRSFMDARNRSGA